MVQLRIYERNGGYTLMAYKPRNKTLPSKLMYVMSDKDIGVVEKAKEESEGKTLTQLLRVKKRYRKRGKKGGVKQ